MSSSDSEHAFAASLGLHDPMLEDGEEYFDDEQYLDQQEYLANVDDDAPIEDYLPDFLTGGIDPHLEAEADEHEYVQDWSEEEEEDNDNQPPQQPAYYNGSEQSGPESVADTDSDSGSSMINPGFAQYPANSRSRSRSDVDSSSASASGDSNNPSDLSSASVSDSEASASSSPSAAASTESSEDQEDPPQHNRRQFSSAFGINARASPRRPSLTPNIHPNRRLPRNHPPSFAERRRQEQLHLQQNLRNSFRAGPSSRPQSQPAPPYYRAYSAIDNPEDDESEGDQSGEEQGDSPSSSDQSSDQDTLDQADESTEGESTEDEQEEEDDEEDEELRELDHSQIRAYLGHRERDQGRQIGQRRAGAEREEGMDADDELVEVVYHQPAPPLNQQQRRQRQQQNGRQNNHNQGPANSREPVHVIDLTEEPDSPVLQLHRPISLPRHHPQQNHIDLNDDSHTRAARHQRRNPRRQMSQSNGRTPALARSDGSLLGDAAAAAVIDLTSDSPDEEREGIPVNRFLPLPVPQQQRNNQRGAENLGRGFMGNLPNFGNFRGNFRDMFMPRIGIFAHLANAPNDAQVIGGVVPANPDPLAGNPPDFNYQANGFGGFGGGRPSTPKPDFEAPPPARPGFSRDTGNNRETDEEQVFVCPSCEDELKYAPEDDDGPRPAKRARTKKDREEHHFWAVKACGHVRQQHPVHIQGRRFADTNQFYYRSTARVAMTTAGKPKTRNSSTSASTLFLLPPTKAPRRFARSTTVAQT